MWTWTGGGLWRLSGALAGKEVELVAEGTGEMLRYRIGIGFLNEAKENPA